MLTNWATISKSLNTLRTYEEMLAEEGSYLNKKEKLEINRKREKLEKTLGGIRNMGGRPDLLFVIDVNNESLAVQEAKRLGIPVAAVVDTNCNPSGIEYVIPGNDDARKSITLFMKLACDAVLAGIQEGLTSAGVDIGKMDMGFDEIANTELPEIFSEEEEAPSKKSKATVVVKNTKANKAKAATIEAEPAKKAAPPVEKAKATVGAKPKVAATLTKVKEAGSKVAKAKEASEKPKAETKSKAAKPKTTKADK
jgi:small subunit ribosomal protein S2